MTESFNRGFEKTAFNTKMLLNTIPKATHGRGMLDMGKAQARAALKKMPDVKKPLEQFRSESKGAKTSIAPSRGTLK